jgi:hypothetical protein
MTTTFSPKKWTHVTGYARTRDSECPTSAPGPLRNQGGDGQRKGKCLELIGGYCSTNQKDMVVTYIMSGAFEGLVGASFSMMIRMELGAPGNQCMPYRLQLQRAQAQGVYARLGEVPPLGR